MTLPNVKIFKEQIKLFKKFSCTGRPNKEQAKDIDYLLALGEILTLVPMASSSSKAANSSTWKTISLDEIFDFMVRDFSKYALNIYSKPSNTDKQREFALTMIKPSRYQRGTVRAGMD